MEEQATPAAFVCFVLTIEAEEFLQFKSHGYYLGYQVNSYSEAESQCEERNSTLAIVNSKAIRDFLVNILNERNTTSPFSYYIGLKRASHGMDVFEWIDGTSQSGGYDGWHTGEPNNKGGNERCVIMGWIYELDADYKWRDVPCNSTSRFICQISSSNESTTKAYVSVNTTTTTKETLGATTNSNEGATTEENTTTRAVNNSSSPQSNKIGLHWILIGVAGLLIVGILVVTYFYCKRKNKKKGFNNVEERNEEFIEKTNSGFINPIAGEVSNVLYESSTEINTRKNKGIENAPENDENEGNQIQSVTYDDIRLTRTDEERNCNEVALGRTSDATYAVINKKVKKKTTPEEE